jgi:chromosome partitioning protein
MTVVTAVASQKGGVAKSTSSINLSAGLARKGKRVLLIDIDPQSNASRVHLKNYLDLKKEQTLYDTIINNKPLHVYSTAVEQLDIVPSHILLSNADIDLQNAFRREERLKVHLEAIKDRYDYVFIDCPPSLNWLTYNALVAADKIIVPVSPGFFELESINQINQTIHEIQTQINHNLNIAGYLYTMGDHTTGSRVSLKVLRQTYPEYTLTNIIPKNVDARDASAAKMDIFAFNPKSVAAEAYTRVIKEVYDVE